MGPSIWLYIITEHHVHTLADVGGAKGNVTQPPHKSWWEPSQCFHLRKSLCLVMYILPDCHNFPFVLENWILNRNTQKLRAQSGALQPFQMDSPAAQLALSKHELEAPTQQC